MRNLFKIDQPTCISFSGGRTSTYMLWRVLQANGGLPDEALVCFANTGKEVEATLRFVQECARRWQVPIHCLEYRPGPPGFAVVNFDRASQRGEPFELKLPTVNGRTLEGNCDCAFSNPAGSARRSSRPSLVDSHGGAESREQAQRGTFSYRWSELRRPCEVRCWPACSVRHRRRADCLLLRRLEDLA